MSDASQDITERARRLLAAMKPIDDDVSFADLVAWDFADDTHIAFADAAPELVRGLLEEVTRLRGLVDQLRPAPVTWTDQGGNVIPTPKIRNAKRGRSGFVYLDEDGNVRPIIDESEGGE